MTTNPRLTAPAVRKATLLSFVFVMYSYTTGGPFGLEEQVSSSGPGMTLLYHLLIPFFWCIPISLVAAELTTAMPVQGGFYRWVRAAFGDFWGFLAGWWNWTASFLLGSVYAVLFADYLGFYFPQLTGRNHYLVASALIAAITYINVRGIQMVGRISTVLEIFVLLPIAVMTVMGLAHWKHNPFVPLVVPLSTATYFLPTFASLAALNNWQQWHGDYFSVAAKLIGGPLLGAWVALAALATIAALRNTTVLATPRMPFALAEDKFLPSTLTRIHPRFGTPAVSIVVSGAIYAAFAMFTLTPPPPPLAPPRRFHRRLRRNLRRVRHVHAHPAHHRIRMAARSHIRDDRACSLEAPPAKARNATPLRDSRGPQGTSV